MIQLGIAEDHILFRKELVKMLEDSGDFKFILKASDGQELVDKYKNLIVKPNILIIDLSMPLMSGTEAVKQIKQLNPSQKNIILSVIKDKSSIANAFNIGVNAYICKGEALLKDLISIFTKVNTNGFYFGNHKVKLNNEKKNWKKYGFIADFSLTHNELEYIQYAATELTYPEIATQMNVSEGVVKKCQESVFLKLEVRTRHSMVIKAISMGLLYAF
ncbi:MAG: response regulator transcription factor [Chitinophagaceae bacterium]|nr:response regulator transcription factor [Chitinophagaceae bacterium]